MFAATDILVFCVQIAVLLLVAGAFWRPVAAVVLLTSGLCGLAFALLGEGSSWLVVGAFAVFCAWRSLQVSFLQVKYAGLDVFSVKAPDKAPSETELLDRLVARMSELHVARRERAAAAKAAAATAPAATAEAAPETTALGGRRTRADRLSSRRLSRPAARRDLSGTTNPDAESDDVPALPHSPDDRKKRLDTSKTSPKAVA
ncbi:hypothetical protein CKO28_25405 [Rhodovibrio sodomensis]|uniref:Uncharacterized protein n=1 Tax=Rhodovibrio sodomensis TaxID=1088 RepID=A0ABS1DMK7_9PROT|nr:hypothetical protein [Rhodovibrio sodomensis]MBK1671342.1 hypothetical protein [Rhodovibrio sodomensis]